MLVDTHVTEGGKHAWERTVQWGRESDSEKNGEDSTRLMKTTWTATLCRARRRCATLPLLWLAPITCVNLSVWQAKRTALSGRLPNHSSVSWPGQPPCLSFLPLALWTTARHVSSTLLLPMGRNALSGWVCWRAQFAVSSGQDPCSPSAQHGTCSHQGHAQAQCKGGWLSTPLLSCLLAFCFIQYNCGKEQGWESG